MAKRVVVWTTTASRQRREIFYYWTIRNKSTKYAERLIILIKKRIKVIQTHPESFKETIYHNTRVSALGNFSILYKFTNAEIIITAFWDYRQDPSELLKIIST